MLKSMTGYGRAQAQRNGRDIQVEIKSVNHRYFEFSARTPRAYGYLDDKLKTLVGGAISRGKCEASLLIYTLDGGDAQVRLNTELARGYVEALRTAGEGLQLQDDLTLGSLLRFSDIFQVSKAVEDEEAVWNDVKAVAEEAVSRFIQMRQQEGERLYADLTGRLKTIGDCVSQVEELSPKTVQAYRERLYAKISEVLEGKGIEEQRILTEAAIFADKVAVDEETVRLQSHLRQFAELITADEPVGRKLDFLTQEINRETNTIGSKCQDIQVTNLVLQMKAEIEKLREQIQNIE